MGESAIIVILLVALVVLVASVALFCKDGPALLMVTLPANTSILSPLSTATSTASIAPAKDEPEYAQTPHFNKRFILAYWQTSRIPL